MGKTKRKFIDKRYDVVHTFKVVQRSQKDPLVVDEKAPQGVLVNTDVSTSHKEELHKYGIYFDDNYDYLQHLRGVQEAVDWEGCDFEVYTIRNEDTKSVKSGYNEGLQLPSSAFESYVEEPIGLLNKAAPVTGPRPELDPDIVAELDSDNEENIHDPEDEEEFPDDFIAQLNAEGEDDDKENEGNYSTIREWLGGTSEYYGNSMPPLEEMSGESDSENDGGKSDESSGGFYMSDEEEEEEDKLTSLRNRPCFRGVKTNTTSRTSASACTVPRTELLQTLDAKFERFMNKEFNDDQIGALDGELIEGPFDEESQVIQQAIASDEKYYTKPSLSNLEGDERDRTVMWIKSRIVEHDDPAEERNFEEEDGEVKLKYDIESYHKAFADYSNVCRNIIDPSMIPKKRTKSALTKKAVKKHNQIEDGLESSDKDEDAVTLLSCISAISIRPKEETSDERRDRKSALKELRRERRKEKKQNKLAFKEELKRQKQIHLSKPKFKAVPVQY